MDKNNPLYYFWITFARAIAYLVLFILSLSFIFYSSTKIWITIPSSFGIIFPIIGFLSLCSLGLFIAESNNALNEYRGVKGTWDNSSEDWFLTKFRRFAFHAIWVMILLSSVSINFIYLSGVFIILWLYLFHLDANRFGRPWWKSNISPEYTQEDKNMEENPSEQIQEVYITPNTNQDLSFKEVKIDHEIERQSEYDNILGKIDSYLSSFGEEKPESITLNSYEWALLDIWLRMSKLTIGGLHSCSYKDVFIKCYGEKCYCHSLFSDEDILILCNDLFESNDETYELNQKNLSLDEDRRLYLNNRFEYFFDGLIGLQKTPKLALKLMCAIGSTLAVDSNNLGKIIWRYKTYFPNGQKFLVNRALLLNHTYTGTQRFPDIDYPLNFAEETLNSVAKDEYTLSDYKETEQGNFVNQKDVCINKKYYDYLTNINCAEKLILKSSKKQNPIILFDGSKKIGAHMPYIGE